MAKEKSEVGHHELGLIKLLKAVIRYECQFCGMTFLKLSDCAKHIEDDSITGFTNPNDIKIVVIKGDNQITIDPN